MGFFKFVLLFLSFIFLGSARSAGYERALMWSGRYSGLAGAAVSIVRGPESLFYNPAGLADQSGRKVFGGLSLALSKASGPYLGETTKGEERKATFPAAILVSYAPESKWGLGAGVYTAAMMNTDFKALDYVGDELSFDVLKPDMYSNFRFYEFAFGGSCQLSSRFRAGATWRVNFIKGSLGLVRITNLNSDRQLVSVELKDLDDRQLFSYRLGFQWEAERKKWGLGFSYRSGLDFEASGKSSGSAVNDVTPSSLGDLTGGSITYKSKLPAQLVSGAFYKYSKRLRFSLDYAYTKYSEVDRAAIDGEILWGVTQVPFNGIDLYWSDMHNVRLGSEYRAKKGISHRFGYAFTSKVAAKKYAEIIFPPPGFGHTITYGIGKKKLTEKCGGDIGMEITMASGEVSGSNGNQPENAKQPISGKFKSDLFALHGGLTCSF